MKALALVGGFVLVLGAMAAAFAAFVWFGASRADPDEHAHLSQRVTAQVVDWERDSDARQRPYAGYRLQVVYEVDEQWYAAEGWVPERRWSPPSSGPTSAVPVCVDPEDPAQVSIPSVADRVVECGEGYLGRNDEQRARQTTQP